MVNRHEAIGIKQTLRYEWLQKTADLLLAGLDARTARRELHAFLSARSGDGAEGERSDGTRTFAVNNLMTIWVNPPAELMAFRNAALTQLREQPATGSAVHWAMVSAVYPFWFNAARQAGRLLSLQGQVTQAQIVNRLRERYGDRQTVSRYGRFVIRSFVAWGVLEDSAPKGCYLKAAPMIVDDPNPAILMLEAALHALPEGRGTLAPLLNSPAFFPFRLPVLSGDFITRHTDRIEVIRYGPDDELLKLVAGKPEGDSRQ